MLKFVDLLNNIRKDDESLPTVKCSTCSEWHHQQCAFKGLDFVACYFVCEMCRKSSQPRSAEVCQSLPVMNTLTSVNDIKTPFGDDDNLNAEDPVQVLDIMRRFKNRG